MVSLRDEIVSDISGSLSGITVSDGYNLDVKKVSVNELKIPTELPADAFPQLFVVDTKESIEVSDIGALEKSLDVVVIAYVKKTSNDAVNTMRRKITADIEKAVCGDPQRSGLAVMTYPKSVLTDEGALEPYGEVDFTFTIVYRQKYGQPDTQE